MVVSTYFLWLVVYSFLGWIYESALCSINKRKLVNRGFLSGPVCPVYGFGALVCIVFLYQKTDHVVLLFFIGMLLTCTVEYITAVLLEKLFHAKWWDYSNSRFHIQGRVCLLGAVIFGLLSVLLVKHIHPAVSSLTGILPYQVQIVLSLVLFIIMMADLYVTVHHLVRLNSGLKEIQCAINRFLEQYAKRAGTIKESVLEKFEESEYYSDRIKTLLYLSRMQNIRILKAFPMLKFTRYSDAWRKFMQALSITDNKKTR